MEEVANGIATAMGGSCTMELAGGVPPCTNDPVMTQLVQRAATTTVGEEHIVTDEEAMTTGSDDMAYFLQSAPGCYFLVGAQNEKVGAAYPHHHPRFNIDEDALPVAVEVLSRAALEFLG
jgi:amidohydrolase